MFKQYTINLNTTDRVSVDTAGYDTATVSVVQAPGSTGTFNTAELELKESIDDRTYFSLGEPTLGPGSDISKTLSVYGSPRLAAEVATLEGSTGEAIVSFYLTNS